MNKLAMLLVCSAVLNTAAQTNTLPIQTNWLAAPQITLRALPLPEEKLVKTELGDTNHPLVLNVQSLEAAATEPARLSLSESLSLSAEPTDFQLQVYDRLDKLGYFTKVIPSDSAFERAIDSTFRPEWFHYRKVAVSCSVATAIKRKNPFCLINPYVLQISW